MNNPVPAAQIIITVIPIVGIVMVSVLIFFYLLWRNKQIILQIQTNTYIPSKFNLGMFCLISGILLLMPLSCGIGLLVFYAVSVKIRRKESADD